MNTGSSGQLALTMKSFASFWQAVSKRREYLDRNQSPYPAPAAHRSENFQGSGGYSTGLSSGAGVPTGGYGNLDTSTEQEILTLLDELHQDGMTIVMVTHGDSVGNRAERTVWLRDGYVEKIVENR